MNRSFQLNTALGCQIILTLISDKSDSEVDYLYRELWLSIFEFEKAFSRFLPASQLSTFNRAAGLRSVITPEFKAVLLAAQDMAVTTGGLYNPFILPALQSAGYKHSMVKGHEKDNVDDYTSRSGADIGALEIGDDWAQIPYGTAIDLGGMGKGFLGDQLAWQVKD